MECDIYVEYVLELRTMDLDFILFSFYFLLFYFILSYIEKGQRRQKCDTVPSHMTWS